MLEVKDLVTTFRIGKKEYEVLRGVSFDIEENETLCMVGESGCGKSVTTLSIMDLLPNNGRVVSGSIKLNGQELTTLSPKERNALRGKQMGMIFQEPMTALNPLLTIGRQMTEGLRLHLGMSREEAYETAVSYLEKVGIANPGDRMKQYPFQLSGGLRQRVMIAMVMAAQPSLLIADEPTTALDVTIQKQVLVLLNRLKKDVSTGILFITHDLGVVAEIADRVIILYSGRKVEEGSIEAIFSRPLHPYTVGLMKAVPNVDVDDFDIQPIPGTFPNITEEIGGCRFHPRCPYATDRCRTEVPAEMEIAPGHFVCCHKVEEEHR
ncbi:ABC transporter ATP-binding protein [Intestinimonas butyriciproducens]|uniref:Oligopeptide transport system ATP-binding protein n=1 Tax=Intestinimonas butyriciproducens TaxID=1297617 RepID=A0A2U1CEX6_9FIRM|nr:ABC transporter ATP-binding protein [Intestinimonas butyriciproducens]MCR1905613.1 ABC transporter ATP-binding protein [Intestinimonas butyriciproducens]PVY59445.1 oligopeptide transport system ATP-binding protein [Intestinimonas butyriciproducens]QBB66228.1 Oligopeptide transport system permease protein OppB [Intestinimonas butyriciproducens]